MQLLDVIIVELAVVEIQGVTQPRAAAGLHRDPQSVGLAFVLLR